MKSGAKFSRGRDAAQGANTAFLKSGAKSIGDFVTLFLATLKLRKKSVFGRIVK
jgi:hypothetical protein